MIKDSSCASVNNDYDLIKILKATDHVITLFYASWCPFCARFLPIFKKHAEIKGRNFVMVQDDQEAFADEYSVKIYPTVLFFERGVVAKRLDGVPGAGLDEKQLTEFIGLCDVS